MLAQVLALVLARVLAQVLARVLALVPVLELVPEPQLALALVADPQLALVLEQTMAAGGARPSTVLMPTPQNFSTAKTIRT